jgi:hypothetical protein
MKLIRQGALTRLTAILPNYRELINIFDIENNPDTLLNRGFNVRWGECLPADSPTRKLGFNSTLIITLTNGVDVRDIDNIASQVGNIYDTIDTILVSFFDQTMLGVPNNMRGLRRANVTSPRLLKGGEYVAFDIEIVVDYTISINN